VNPFRLTDMSPLPVTCCSSLLVGGGLMALVLALQKDAPLHRAVQRSGVIVAIPILAGLHHQYVRILFSERTRG
jgi:hypothetical protein